MADLRTCADVDCVWGGYLFVRIGIGAKLMLRKDLPVIVCFLLLALPIVAQDENEWSVWMWNNSTQELMRVYEDGSRLIVPIRLPYGYIIDDYYYWYFPEFTRDGRYMTICARIGADNTVFVYDLMNGSQVAYFNFTYAHSCYAVFDETGTRLAIGLAWWLDEWFWHVNSRMIVLEIGTGRVLSELRPGRRHPDTSEWFPFVGYPVTFEGDIVHFDEVPYEGRTRVWEWNIKQGTFSEMVNYPHPISYLQSRHLLGIGERIELEVNTELEYEQTYGLGAGHKPNVINVLGNDGNRTPILYSPTSDIRAISFIDNGRKIALLTRRDWENVGWTHYLDRNGGLFALPPEIQQYRVTEELYGTADGFVLFREPEDGLDDLIHYRFEDDDLISSVLWQAETSDETWDVVWVTPLEGEPGLRPLTDLEMITFTGTE